ncbi:hypothetical protein C806_01110 [Lachnospiraceae bacterium 3-1]|nr:hypothetical protein C806_01110 [Lachnospiraceae bacterium 3-1]
MIGRKDILSIPYLKKTAFTGSYEGLRFRFAVVKKEVLPDGEQGKEIQLLEVTAWEGPYGFDATPEEKKQRLEMDFSEEGIQKGIDWLNELWNQEPKRWIAAKSNW